MAYKVFFSLLFLFGLIACDSGNINGGLPVPSAPPRQLDAIQLTLGKQIFTDNCAQCHGDETSGWSSTLHEVIVTSHHKWGGDHRYDIDRNFPQPV